MSQTSSENLPNSWALPLIKEVCDIMSGQTPKGVDQFSHDDKAIPWFRISDMNEPGNEKYLTQANINLALEDTQELKLHIRPQGTIVFPKRGGAIATNKKRLLAQPSAYDLNIMGICSIGFENNFLWHWFQSVDLGDLSDGSNVPQINHGDIEALDIPLPPLNEQRRIVEKIEALSAHSRNARQALDAIPALLDQFRQSVLAAAFRGDLTADWRAQHPDVEPASALLERIRTERRQHWEAAELEKMRAKGKEPKNDKWKEKYKEPISPEFELLRELPESWCWATLDQMMNKIVDGTHHTPTYVSSGIPFLSVKDIRDGKLYFDDCKYVSSEEHNILCQRCFPEVGDLLITKSGTIGRCAVVKTPRPFSLFVSVALLKPASTELSTDFISTIFQAWFQTINVSNDITGTAIKNFHLIDFRKLALPMPPQEEQCEIMKQVDSLMSYIDNLAASFKSLKGDCSQLDQSILAKAFRGQLVPQDPTDEPASHLLARIRTEREAAAKATQKTRTGTKTAQTKASKYT